MHVGQAIVNDDGVFRNIVTPDWTLQRFGVCWGMRDQYVETGRRIVGPAWHGNPDPEPPFGIPEELIDPAKVGASWRETVENHGWKW